MAASSSTTREPIPAAVPKSADSSDADEDPVQPLESSPLPTESTTSDAGSEGEFPGQAVLQFLPDGVCVLDRGLIIRWRNDKLLALCQRTEVAGSKFTEVFGSAEQQARIDSLAQKAFAGSATVRVAFNTAERLAVELSLTPMTRASANTEFVLATIRDISADEQQQQKLSAIYAAGIELGAISAEDLRELNVDGRIELLKEKIIRITQDVLQFETIEIRLLEKSTGRLIPLLNVGMAPEAAERTLFAKPEGNGVTGFVAAGGGSYLCPDTSQDPRYLPGAPNARSSLTVPLILHDEILGTFNVESDRPGAFTQRDLEFLELFGREVAVAINTLDLLAGEKVSAATQYTGMILREVARPVDEILNCTTWILDRYIGHDPAVCERLQKVQKHTRDIKTLIQKVNAAMTPAVAPHAANPPPRQHPRLRSKRILVVDNDEAVRDHAHAALGQFGCEVETAHNGEEALLMARTFHYDVVIVDIRLPDMNGYECFVQLRNINEHLPVILMTGFGYDPGHSIVKARQAGLKSALYKPFRLDQLLAELERAITTSVDHPPRA